MYPILLAGEYLALGHAILVPRLTQTVLGTVTVALISLLGYRLFGRSVGLVALGVAAVYPALILVDAALLTESLFIPLMLGALLTALRFRRAGGLL
ncbi:MAG TPA: glycosyltransferase family 39 protein [Mycobacteriales bacterium]|nr:glycosyltransferase family 39 protein [Mycobacteriales bacterium]